LRPEDVEKPKGLHDIVFDISCGLYVQHLQADQAFAEFSADHGGGYGD
jgi:hypothetical protein